MVKPPLEIIFTHFSLDTSERVHVICKQFNHFSIEVFQSHSPIYLRLILDFFQYNVCVGGGGGEFIQGQMG